MNFSAGQSWSYRAPEGFENSRIVIGAIVRFEDRESVVCCCVYGAPKRASSAPNDVVAIPFVPLSESAFAASVTALDGEAELPEEFAVQLHAWANDDRGLAVFTVPFLGYLNQLMAMQMAAMTGSDQAQNSPAA